MFFLKRAAPTPAYEHSFKQSLFFVPKHKKRHAMDPFQISSTFCLWLITLASSDKFSRINTHFSMRKLQGLVDLPP
jgi:hypothetical protein